MADGNPREALDLATCDREPIRIPGSIQPHGFLMALDGDDLVLVQASANLPKLVKRDLDDALGRRLDELLPNPAGVRWSDLLSRHHEHGAVHLRQLMLPLAERQTSFSGVAHQSDGLLVLELEPSTDLPIDVIETLDVVVSSFAGKLQTAVSIIEIGNLAARQVRRIIGFDRVLVYRFDEHWNGTVIAEDRNEALPSYLDLRFPASDIPAQARDLYRLNRQRLIPDAHYVPVPIVPALNPHTGRPLDLAFAHLRSVSPIHLEYMRNMGTGASMSISLLRDGELWGLISCHNRAPKRVPMHLRTACELLGQLVSLRIAAEEHGREASRRIEHRAIGARLLAQMAIEDRFVDGLVKHGRELLRLASADGAAILHEGECRLVGETPPEEVVREIVAWLQGRIDEVFWTDSLAREMPGAEAYKDTASGLLAVSISQLHPSYALWFRPEVVRTVKWGGDPHKPVIPEPANLRLHPRKSFEMWKETVELRSQPWQPSEIEAVRELRSAIVGIVMRKAEELASLTEELRRSNKELEAFSYSVSHDLRAPFRHIVGYAELLREYESENLSERGRRFIGTIIDAAFSAARLIDNLLDYSRMGRSEISPMLVDMNVLIAEVRRSVEKEVEAGRRLEWWIGHLDPAYADPLMLQIAVGNLLANAVKYTRPRNPAVIEVGSERHEQETIYHVRDNGVGFDMAYAPKLFGVFQRLHLVEDFEGTGIGLANVRRIIERHGGRTWAEGEVDRGATFYFSLPNAPRTE